MGVEIGEYHERDTTLERNAQAKESFSLGKLYTQGSI